MTSGGSVTVDVAGRDVNLVALLARMETSMKRTDQIGIQLASTVGTTFTAAQTRAANAAITEAQALARAAQAAGDDARAHTILVGALGNASAASDRSVASLTTSINRLQSGSTVARQFGDAMKSSLLSIVGPAALVSGGLLALRSALDQTVQAFKLKAELDATTASINAQLKGVRDTSQVYREAAAFGREFKLTQQETTQAIAASIGVMRSSKAPIEDILGVLARMQVLSPEQSLQEAAIALKALASGDTTSLVTRFEVGRDVATQMKNEIQGGADAVQVMSKFLGDTGIGMDALKARAEGASGALKDAAVQAEKFQLALAGKAGGPGEEFLALKTNLLKEFTAILSGDFAEIETRNRINAEAQAAYNAALAQGKTDAEAYAAAQVVLNTVSSSYADLLGPAIEATVAFATTQANLTSGIQTEIEASIQAGNATRLQTQATADATAEAQVATAAQAALTAEAALLTAQTQAAVDAFLALNPNLSASGAAAAASAAGYSPLIVRLIELAVRSREARAELAALNALAGVAAAAQADFRAGERTGGRARTVADEGRMADAHANTARHAREAAEAEARYQQQAGNVAPLLARRRAELARLTTGSAAYFDKLREISQLEASAARKGRGGGGGGGAGAVKLSDQQKLNNTLLADQERYQDQAEAAERAHTQKLLDIDRDFQKKSLEQQQRNEISKRESELGYLESITASELNATEEGRAAITAINERYYADFEKAQQAAQAGNAAQSEAMVKAAGERAGAEQRYAEQIEQARQDDNGSEITRLEALREKQRQILDEKDKQIAAGDPNVIARQEAIAEEERAYAESQEKVGTAAEQAAQRKVDAAIRSGKAVTDENVLLLEQEAILSRMGRTAAPGATAGPLPAAGAAAAVPAAPVTPPPTASLDTLAGLLEAAVAAIQEARAGIVRAQGETTSAIKGMRGGLV